MPEPSTAQSEQPEYVYRPAIYFHAENDEQARRYAAQLRASIEDEVTCPTRWAYDQVWHEEKTLSERLHFPVVDGANVERVV